jgi:flagellar protein FlaG
MHREVVSRGRKEAVTMNIITLPNIDSVKTRITPVRQFDPVRQDGDTVSQSQAVTKQSVSSTKRFGTTYGSNISSGNPTVASENSAISLSMDNLKKIAEETEKELSTQNSRIAIKIDENTETPVVQFIDKESGEVIRQMPHEEMLKLRAKFKEMISGLFFNREA